MKHSEYTSYFRTIAQKHVDLRHTESECHFARIILSADPFRKMIIEEFITGLRGKIKAPFMLLESYDADYNDNKADNIFKNYSGAFLLLDKAPPGDFNKQEEIIDHMEEIGEDIFGYIKNDLRQVSNLPKYSINPSNIHSEKVGNIADGFYGMRFDFEFSKTANINLKFNPSKFI